MSQTSIAHAFQDDHSRLDHLFKSFQSLKRIDFTQAKPYFKEFKLGLQRHIIWEEQILFPVFDAKTGMNQSGPTQVMRAEHLEIGKALEKLHDKVRARDPESDAEEAALIGLLSAHNRKEENVLYPMIDQSTSDDEKAVIFKKMSEHKIDLNACCGGHSH